MPDNNIVLYDSSVSAWGSLRTCPHTPLAIYGSADDDFLFGCGKQEKVYGESGNDWLDGCGGDDKLHGGGGSDALYGEQGNDLLCGGRGVDLLSGGAGHDVLCGGKGRDWFEFYTSAPARSSDLIMDFTPGQDIIFLNFSFIEERGALNPDIFVASASGDALDADDRILYETDTGMLFYDDDGNGVGAKVLLAIVGTDTHPVLNATDFVTESMAEPYPF